MPPQALILRAPGTNCDEETAVAFQRAGAATRRVHVNRLLEQPAMADAFQILCIPGGFSYGDDIAAGRILASQIHHHLTEQIERFRAADKLILGICNGFQVLLKSGALLAEDAAGPVATLTWNDSGKFEDRWVRLAVVSRASVFFAGIESLRLPVAHAEGKFVTRATDTLARLAANDQLVLRYGNPANAAGDGSVPYPDNPNGSWGNVAAVCDETGRVLGMMPHPERFIEPSHAPCWTRQKSGSVGDGLRVFENAVRYFQ